MSSPAPKPTAEELLEHALQLPKEQRLRLADQLLDSVDEFSQIDDDQLDPELREELVRRLKSIEDGTAELLDGDEVMRELRAKYVR
jgi:putative addiction module component (TIGR02574 family)